MRVDPVDGSSRIVALDILRGIALFGMILVHFHQRREKPAAGTEDLVGWFVWMFVEGKAWATFAFLFGAGFAILMRRAEARGRRVVPLFLRRMAALAVFGILVKVLFGFTILLDYAIWGVVLLLIRNLPTRVLLIIALCSAAALTVASKILPASGQHYAAHWKALNEAEVHGTFTEAVAARAEHGWWWYTRPRILIPDRNLVLFIVGLLAIRHGIFEDARRRRGAILTMMTFGLVSWSAVWLLYFKFPKFDYSGYGILSDQWLAFTYVGAIILLLAYRPAWKQRLAPFGIAGRMALTNYVLQAAMLSVLACGYGFGLKIRPYYDIPAAILLFGACVALSTLWLARFTYGPLERIWRWFTYAEWNVKINNEVIA